MYLLVDFWQFIISTLMIDMFKNTIIHGTGIIQG